MSHYICNRLNEIGQLVQNLKYGHSLNVLILSFSSEALSENWQATISFVVSVRPSVRMELNFHWSDFHEILNLSFSKICRENTSFIKI